VESVLGVGRLTSLELLDPQSGRSRTKSVRGKYLAWRPKARAFTICTIKRKAAQKVSAAVERAHRKFHLAPSRRALVIERPEPVGELKQLGLIKALTYFTPNPSATDGINSPSKNNAHWHHAFGDTGHRGGTYTPKVMPALCRDKRGNLFICRRKGNIFTVDSWLRG
jgi:hypothetical protein